jgi:hypothetical protein
MDNDPKNDRADYSPIRAELAEEAKRLGIDPDDTETRPEQILNLSERPEFRSNDDNKPTRANVPKLSSDPNNERFTETVHQRRVRLKAEKEGITREEAERLIAEETAARFRGDYSPSKKFEASLDLRDVTSPRDAILYLNKDHFKTVINGKFKIVRENPDGTIEIMDKKDFISNHDEYRLSIEDEKGNAKSTPITKLWLESSEARKYDKGLEFDPSHVGHRNGKYNLFKGYKIKPIEGDVAPFLGLMKDVICSGHERNSLYLEVIVADMVKNPHLKPGIAVVIRGIEGVGKSFFVEKLGALMGEYYFKTSNPSYIFGDHNGQLKNKILLHLEEAIWAGSKKDESQFKDIITGPTLEINEKFIPMFQVANHLHLFITGNPDWLVKAGLEARRIFALHASDDRRNDTEYFGDLDKWFNNGGAQALMHYFLNYDIQAALGKLEIKHLRNVLITEELIEQRQQSLTPLQEWLMSIADTLEMPYGEIQPDGSVRVIKQLLYIDYLNSPMGKRQPLNPVKFGDQFLALLPTVVNGIEQKAQKGRRVNTVVKTDNIKIRDSRQVRRDGYEIPDFGIVRSCLEFRLGGSKVWGTVDGIDYDEESKEMKRCWRVLRPNTEFEFDAYKPESTGRY